MTVADGAREKGADGGGGQGDAGTTLEGHLIAVERRHDGGGLSGQVHQDRGGRPAVLRPVVDPGQHDQRRHGREDEGGRHEHGDRRGRSEAGENADQGADEDADQAVEQVEGGEGRMKAELRDPQRVPCSTSEPGPEDRDRQAQQPHEEDRGADGEPDGEAPGATGQRNRLLA